MYLKAIQDQVMVITGASSGMGLVTARAAAGRGARLVLVSRDEETLNKLVKELTTKGAQAIAVPADMTVEADVQRVADQAIEHFGGFDKRPGTRRHEAGIRAQPLHPGPVEASDGRRYRHQRGYFGDRVFGKAHAFLA